MQKLAFFHVCGTPKKVKRVKMGQNYYDPYPQREGQNRGQNSPFRGILNLLTLPMVLKAIFPPLFDPKNGGF